MNTKIVIEATANRTRMMTAEDLYKNIIAMERIGFGRKISRLVSSVNRLDGTSTVAFVVTVEKGMEAAMVDAYRVEFASELEEMVTLNWAPVR